MRVFPSSTSQDQRVLEGQWASPLARRRCPADPYQTGTTSAGGPFFTIRNVPRGSERGGRGGRYTAAGLNRAEFRHPPVAFGPMAMWFLNADLDDAELRRQVDAMAAGRVGGIQVAARTGLQTPYLSERWFAAVALIQDAAERHGIPVWLADEYPYPSGASGGEVVLRHPDYRAWQMDARHMTVEPGQAVRAVAPGTVCLRACGVPIVRGERRWAAAVDLASHVGLVQHQQVLFEPSRVYLTTQRYMSNAPRPTLDWEAPRHADGWEIWLIAAAEITEYKFFGSYVDLCNPDATALFLNTTHERYVRGLGPDRFARLAGWFLDESHPQSWSWRLPDFFREQRGYDLVAGLPALWTDMGPDTARIRVDYRQTLTDLFDQSFMRPVADWCARQRVQLSLEVPSTRNTVQRHASVPGIDPGHDKVGVALDDILARELPNFRANMRFPASLAAQTGKPRVLDELFHSVGWSLTLQDMKAMLDRAAAQGANLFAFHAFCYTIGGLRKWDAPPSEFEQNPYWPYFSRLGQYTARLAYALSRGRPVAPVAVLDPITSLWAHATLPGVHDSIGQRVQADWSAVLRELMAAHRPYQTLDPRLLAEAAVEDGHLRLGDADYTVVVVPSVTNLERAAWSRLQEFVASGGTVIAIGALPSERIETEGDVVQNCQRAFGDPAGEGFVHVDSTARLLEVLEACAPLDLWLASADGTRDLLIAQRQDGDEALFFLANASMVERTCDIRLRAPTATVERLDLETGDTESVPVWRDGAGQLCLRLAFARHGAQLLVVRPSDGPSVPEVEPVPAGWSGPLVDLDLDGDWQVDLPDGALNVLRLDRFRFALSPTMRPDQVRWPDRPVVVQPKPLINVLRAISEAGEAWPGGIDVQPVFGASPHLGPRLPSTAWYASTFAAHEIPAQALLCVEDLALAGDWEIWINGQPIARQSFVRRRRWSIDTREADIRALLTAGRNEVLVRVQVTEASDGLVDAIYVLGDFGVFVDDADMPVLDRTPSTLRWSERHQRGFPFYSGTYRLRTTRALEVTGGDWRLQLPDEILMFAGVVEVDLNGRALGVRAWAPYAWTVPADVVAASTPTDLTLRITTTLVEQLEGKWYDPEQRRTVSVM